MAFAQMSVSLARIIWLCGMRLKEGSTLREGSPAQGTGRTRRNEFQLYDKFASTTDGPLVEFKMRKM